MSATQRFIGPARLYDAHTYGKSHHRAMSEDIHHLARTRASAALASRLSRRPSKIIITPGPNSNDNNHLERACTQYCDRLRKRGETGLSCNFVHAPPYRPNPIPQSLQQPMLQWRHCHGGREQANRGHSAPFRRRERERGKFAVADEGFFLVGNILKKNSGIAEWDQRPSAVSCA